MKKVVLLLMVIAAGAALAMEWNIRRGLKQDMLAAFGRYDLLIQERYRPVPGFAAAYDAAQPENPVGQAIAATSSFSEPSVTRPSAPLLDALGNWQSAVSVEMRIRAVGILESELNSLLARATNEVAFRTNAILLELQSYLAATRPMIGHAFETYSEARNAYLKRTQPGQREF
jgi:hypothetical protein